MRTSLLRRTVFSFLALVGFPLVAWTADAPISIGVIANLTGSDVPSSVDMVRGVQLATEQINTGGGINGKQIKLIVEDSEYRPQAGIEAATKLFDVNQVPAAIVFGGSSVTLPIAEMAAPKGRIILNTSASSSKLGNFAGTLFSTLPLDDIVGKELGAYAAKMGAKTAAFIVPNNTFGTGLMEAAAASYTAAGGKVLRKIIYTEGQPDYRPDLQPLQEAKPDAIISAGYGDDTRTVFKAARELGIVAPWYVAYPSIFTVEQPAWMEGKLSGIDNGGLSGSVSQQIKADYTRKFTGEPRPHYYYAYDAMMLLARSMQQAGIDTAAIKAALPSAAKGYDGATGRIEWDARGQRINPPLDYFLYKGGKLETVAAP